MLVGGTITKWKLGKLRLMIWKCYRNDFTKQDDHKGFLEDAELRLIDKTQGSDSTKRQYYWMRPPKTLYPEER